MATIKRYCVRRNREVIIDDATGCSLALASNPYECDRAPCMYSPANNAANSLARILATGASTAGRDFTAEAPAAHLTGAPQVPEPAPPVSSPAQAPENTIRCDICYTPGPGTIVPANQFGDAVRKGFNPFSNGCIPDAMARMAAPGYPERWAQSAIDGDTSHSDWNVCDQCMPKLSKYLAVADTEPAEGGSGDTGLLNLLPGSHVPRTGVYRCTMCAHGDAAVLQVLADYARRQGVDPASLGAKLGGAGIGAGEPITRRTFRAGERFDECPRHRGATGWSFAADDGAPPREAVNAAQVESPATPMMECPPFPGTVKCSDRDCRCSGHPMPPEQGFLWIRPEVASRRRQCLSLSAMLEQMAAEGVPASDFDTLRARYLPLVVCGQAARQRRLDEAVAKADFASWLSTSHVPCRATPLMADARIETRTRPGKGRILLFTAAFLTLASFAAMIVLACLTRRADIALLREVTERRLLGLEGLAAAATAHTLLVAMLSSFLATLGLLLATFWIGRKRWPAPAIIYPLFALVSAPIVAMSLAGGSPGVPQKAIEANREQMRSHIESTFLARADGILRAWSPKKARALRSTSFNRPVVWLELEPDHGTSPARYRCMMSIGPQSLQYTLAPCILVTVKAVEELQPDWRVTVFTWPEGDYLGSDRFQGEHWMDILNPAMKWLRGHEGTGCLVMAGVPPPECAEAGLSSQDPKLAPVLVSLGAFHELLSQPDQAERVYRQSLSIQEKALGTEDPSRLTSLVPLALLLHQQGQYRQAEPLYQDVLALARRRFGPDHAYVAILLDHFAALCRATGREAMAAEAEHRAAGIRAPAR